MRASVRIIAIAVCVFLLAAYAPAQANLKATIEAQGQEFIAHLKKGDAAAIAAMYTADAQAFPPNGEIAQGRAAIQKLWQGAMESGMRDLKFTVLEVVKKGDIAYEVGKYSMPDASGKEVDAGKYIVIWKREAGKWKLFRDIWNSSYPAPAAK